MNKYRLTMRVYAVAVRDVEAEDYESAAKPAHDELIDRVNGWTDDSTDISEVDVDVWVDDFEENLVDKSNEEAE